MAKGHLSSLWGHLPMCQVFIVDPWDMPRTFVFMPRLKTHWIQAKMAMFFAQHHLTSPVDSGFSSSIV